VLYEDDDVSQSIRRRADRSRRAGNVSGTLVNALLGRGQALSQSGDPLRPESFIGWIRNSGVIVVAKNDAAHAKLGEAFRQRAIKKTYIALVQASRREERTNRAGHWARSHPSHAHDDGAQILAWRGIANPREAARTGRLSPRSTVRPWWKSNSIPGARIRFEYTSLH